MNGRHKRRSLLAVALLMTAAPGCRASAADSAPEQEPEAAPAATPVPEAARLSLGPSLYLTPSHPGARSTRSVWVPFVDAEYAGRLYSSASDVLGVYAWNTSAVQAGAAVEYDLTERLARDDERFRHLRDVHETPRLKLFASRTISFVTGDANIATDVAGRGEGTLAQANLWATLPFTPKFMVSVGPGFTWADERYMRTFFGISTAQAAVSPFAAFAARAGSVDLHWNGLETIEVSSRWSIGASQYLARLQGSATDSPVTARRSQATVLAWVAYKLR